MTDTFCIAFISESKKLEAIGQEIIALKQQLFEATSSYKEVCPN